MFGVDNWGRALLLAYYLTGVNMVLFHAASAPGDRPRYTSKGFWHEIIAGVLWPYTAYVNRQLGWFGVTYLGSVVVVTGIYAFLGLFLDHGFWRTLLATIVATTPLGAMPLAIVSTLLWLVLKRPLGLSVPPAIERTQDRHNTGKAFADAEPGDLVAGAPGATFASALGPRILPPEIEELLASIESLSAEVPEALSHVALPVLSGLRDAIRVDWTGDDIARYISVAREGHSAESFVCNHLAHSMADELESGRLHVYRGVLSGIGQTYRAVFDYAIQRSVASGAVSAEWAEERLRRPVYETIKRVG